jgi:hypothetical protein
MRRALSPGTGRRYPLTMICAVFRVPRSTIYRTTAPTPAAPLVTGKRGPRRRTAMPRSWRRSARCSRRARSGEGYRKVRARLAHRGLAVGGKRVLRLMRVHSPSLERCSAPECFSSSCSVADPGDRDAGVNDADAHEAPGADRLRVSGRWWWTAPNLRDVETVLPKIGDWFLPGTGSGPGSPPIRALQRSPALTSRSSRVQVRSLASMGQARLD